MGFRGTERQPKPAISGTNRHGTARGSRNSPEVIAQLNPRWRFATAPAHWHPQWNLQLKKGSSRPRDDGWVGSAYCATKAALSRNIRERCGPVSADALAEIDALPAHIDDPKEIGRLPEEQRPDQDGCAIASAGR